MLNKYYDELEIKFFHGRPYHPQSQGTVKSFNKEIKRLIEIKYMESKKYFSIYTILPDIIEIYNNNIHSSTLFKPKELFYTTD